jgi:hypothetical protein
MQNRPEVSKQEQDNYHKNVRAPQMEIEKGERAAAAIATTPEITPIPSPTQLEEFRGNLPTLETCRYLIRYLHVEPFTSTLRYTHLGVLGDSCLLCITVHKAWRVYLSREVFSSRHCEYKDS